MRKALAIVTVAATALITSWHPAHAAGGISAQAAIQQAQSIVASSPAAQYMAHPANPDYYMYAEGASCESGGTTCFSGDTLVSPLTYANLQVIRFAPGSLGHPDIVAGTCVRVVPTSTGMIYQSGTSVLIPGNSTLNGAGIVTGDPSSAGQFISLGIYGYPSPAPNYFSRFTWASLIGRITTDNPTETITSGSLYLTVGGQSASSGPVPPRITCRIGTSLPMLGSDGYAVTDTGDGIPE